MKNTSPLFLVLSIVLFYSCVSNKKLTQKSKNTSAILALGDSYTIGESVCEICRFPEQLKDSLLKRLGNEHDINLTIIAKTGWTTSDLKLAIAKQKPANNYNLVTLLIGVNNQYQNKPFELYETEFPELVNTAILKANNSKKNVVVVSIPDYTFTPFGKSNTTISKEIEKYNAFAEDYCLENNIAFVNITDITKAGLMQPNLVAKDGLHPSKIAYSKFVKRLLPLVLECIK